MLLSWAVIFLVVAIIAGFFGFARRRNLRLDGEGSFVIFLIFFISFLALEKDALP